MGSALLTNKLTGSALLTNTCLFLLFYGKSNKKVKVSIYKNLNQPNIIEKQRTGKDRRRKISLLKSYAPPFLL